MPRKGKLVIIKRNGDDGADYPLIASSVLLGRAQHSDIQFADINVSREHSRIDVDETGDIYCVTHLSRNQSTFLNEKEVTQTTVLCHLDILRIQDRSFRFELPPAAGTQRSQAEVAGEEVVVVESSDEEDEHYEWVYDPEQHEIPAPDSAHHLPVELQNQLEDSFDEDSDTEDNTHIGLWRDGDLGTLALALNYYRDDLKGKFVGTAGGRDRRRKAWIAVAEYVNNRCQTNWSVPQCKTKLTKYTQIVKEKLINNRKLRMKTGSGELPPDAELSETDEMFLDYVGTEGVVGVPGIHGVSLIPDIDQRYLDIRQEAAYREWDHKRDYKPEYSELPGGFIKLPKTARPTKRKR